MQKVTPLAHPALYTALTYLFTDSVPMQMSEIPEEFVVSDGWDLTGMDAALSILSGPPLASGPWAWHPGEEVMDSELYRVVMPEDGDISPLLAKYPEQASLLEQANEFFESCFDGDDSDYWRISQ